MLPTTVSVILYTDVPLVGTLADLPNNWTQKVLKWPPQRLWTQVRLSTEMVLHPPDVLFIPAHVFPILHPKKTVMTIHDVAARHHPQAYNWFERWYTIWSARQALNHLWRVIVPSEFTRAELIKMKPSAAQKIKTIPLGYDRLRYPPAIDHSAIEPVLAKYGIRQPFILSVGRLEEKKNTPRIIEAFNHIKSRASGVDTQLVLIGKPGHGYQSVSRAIETSLFKSAILELGWVDTNDVPIIMSAAKVFVFPSLYEGFGIPVLEAMACGVPVVTSAGTSLTEVGGTAPWYVDPLDTVSLISVLEHLITPATTAMELAIAEKIALGLEQAKKFSWQQSARTTAELLLEMSVVQ